MAARQVETAKAQLDARQHDLEVAEARLKGPSSAATEESCCVVVTAPVNGIVLRVSIESEQIVQAGTPLVDDTTRSLLTYAILAAVAVAAFIVAFRGTRPA